MFILAISYFSCLDKKKTCRGTHQPARTRIYENGGVKILKSSYDLALELMLQSKPDIKRVTLLLNKGVEEGNSDSAYALGTWYLFGENFEKDMALCL